MDLSGCPPHKDILNQAKWIHEKFTEIQTITQKVGDKALDDSISAVKKRYTEWEIEVDIHFSVSHRKAASSVHLGSLNSRSSAWMYLGGFHNQLGKFIFSANVLLGPAGEAKDGNREATLASLRSGVERLQQQVEDLWHWKFEA